jgi:Ca2+-binding EF-hand superfamily protein
MEYFEHITMDEQRHGAIGRLFHVLDEDQSGSLAKVNVLINLRESEAARALVQTSPHLRCMKRDSEIHLRSTPFEAAVANLETKSEGCIEWEEFLLFMEAQMRKQAKREALGRLFKELDVEKTGYVDKKGFVTMLSDRSFATTRLVANTAGLELLRNPPKFEQTLFLLDTVRDGFVDMVELDTFITENTMEDRRRTSTWLNDGLWGLTMVVKRRDALTSRHSQHLNSCAPFSNEPILLTTPHLNTY